MASLVGGCREDSKSFILVSVARCESVSHASRTVVCFAEQNALLCGEDVWLCMCACVRVGFDKNNMPALLAFSLNVYIYIYI